MKKIFELLLFGLTFSACSLLPSSPPITDFDSCVAVKKMIQESYPPRCVADGITYTQDIGNELDLQDTIRVDSPRPNTIINSPLTITGQARGTFYFEASFPVILLNASGQEIAASVTQANGEWMTEDFVPFTATLTFPTQPQGSKGTLILSKDNPSGLPENDLSLRIPILF